MQIWATLAPKSFLIIAGRGEPNWDGCWPEWLVHADIEEVKPMPPAVMRRLVQRYYRSLTKKRLDVSQVEGIVQFARGLPIAITSAVNLMVKYRAQNFRSISPKVVEDLAKRLMEGVPEEFKPALRAAATLRWFDEPTLRAVMQKNDVYSDYNSLITFPFVVFHGGRFALHDVVRETLDKNFQTRDLKQYYELHARAAEYFEHQLEDRSAKKFGE